MLDQEDKRFAERRRDMVRDYIEARGVRSRNVLDAMCEVRREAFLPASMRESRFVSASP
jgi:protein-L-isoaspartate O-methyltransferase